MNDPQLNPTIQREQNGRRRRHVLFSTAVRTFKADRATEHHLITLRQWLDNTAKAGDVVSVSMLARRALAVYASHVAALSVDPMSLAVEREKVRQGTRLPNLRTTSKRKTAGQRATLAAPRKGANMTNGSRR